MNRYEMYPDTCYLHCHDVNGPGDHLRTESKTLNLIDQLIMVYY